ncbi:MAG: tetratricopeptide repeat protein [Bacteroidia bacterium]
MVKKLFLLLFCTFSLLFSQNTELETAYQASLEAGNTNHTIRLLDRLVFFYKRRDTTKAKTFIREAQKLTEANPSDTYNAYVKLMKGYVLLVKPGGVSKAEKMMEEAQELAKRHSNDTLYSKCLTDLGDIYIFQNQFDKGVSALTEAIEINKRLDRQKDLAYTYDRLGEAYGRQNRYHESVDAGAKAIQIARKEGLTQDLLNYIGNQGIALYYLGKHKAVIKSLLEVAKIEEEIGAEAGLMTTLSNIQALMNEVDDNSTSIKYGKRALVMARKLKQKNLELNILANTANSYQALHQYDSALILSKEAVTLARQLEVIDMEAIINGNIGSIHLEMGNVQAAEKNFLKVLELRGQHPEITTKTIVSLTNIGVFFVEQGRFKEALPLLEEANESLQKSEEAVVLGKNCAALAKAYAALGQHQKAYQLQAQASVIRDTIFNRDNIRTITKLESEYEFQKESEKQELAFQAERERANLIRTGLLIGLGLAALVLFFIFRNYQIQRKANALLREKNIQIESQKEQLASLNDTKDRIFSIIGHDLRKPAISFRGIGKKVNYLLKKQDYTTLNQLGSEIERDALALNKLTDDLLSWALLQKDIMPYNPAAINLSDVTEETMSIFAQVARDKSIQLENNVPESMKAHADLNGLRTILRNLIDNGIKYTPEGGTVKIGADAEGEGIKIVVEDSGVGIPQEKLQDIHLLQANKSEQGTGGEKGSGLGLHLVDELVRLNQGSLKVLSELGKGTSIEISLPRLAPAM